ncbi:MAG: pepQ 2 [Firmicutes bacterium]|nr:pepQ 2 [Bacillota bacterium]
MSERITRLRNYLQQQNLDGVMISKPENRRYFSNFTGSAGMLLVTGTTLHLLTDFRYMEQAEEQATEYQIVNAGAKYSGSLLALCQQIGGIIHVGFESDYMTYDDHCSFERAMTNIVLEPTRIDHLRMIKDSIEIYAIREAVRIADEAFTRVLPFIKPGVREADIACELEYIMRKQGSERPAFDTIVASGKRGALPHGRASDKRIAQGDMITMDFGAVYDDYHSDITRTIVLGPVNPKQREIYELVLTAQLAGIRAVAAGRMCREVDAAARKIIEDAGYGKYFGHGLGHSLGLAIHEEPRFSPSAGDILLEKNMVMTVEPGVYLPEWGGVRIEDTVLVSDQQGVVLTSSTKKLIELDC